MKKKYKVLLLSFFLPVAVLLIVFCMLGITPFGEQNIFSYDMSEQYVGFFSYFKSVLQGENNIFYSFSQAFGDEFIGMLSYYLLSPFNLILLLFEVEDFSYAVMLMLLLKLGTASMTFTYLISYKKWDFCHAAFGLCYALISYNIAYSMNIMWLDGILILPIMVLGIQQLMEGKQPYLYIGALCYGLITSYYIGFMLCLFSALFFFIHLLLGEIRTRKEYAAVIVTYAFSSIISAGICAVILVPSFLSLLGGKGFHSAVDYSLYQNFHAFDIFSRFYFGSWEQFQIVSGIPNVYSGMLSVLLGIFYFCNSSIAWKEKAASALLLLVLMLSMYVNPLNLIWHGMNPPTGYPYRYSFIFSFYLLYLSWRAFTVRKSLKKVHFIIAGAGIIGLSVLIFKEHYSYMGAAKISISMALFFIFMGLLACEIKKEHLRKWIVPALLGVCMIDMGGNAYSILQGIPRGSQDNYVSYTSKLQEAVQSVKAQDDTFYRMEQNFTLADPAYFFNNSFLFQYHGLSAFSSSTKEQTKKMAGALGYCQNYLKIIYGEGSTLAADSLLGVKYVISDHAMGPYFLPVYDKDGITVYENKLALPIGMIGSRRMNTGDISYHSTFDLQNDMTGRLLDQNITLFHKLDFKIQSYENVQLLPSSAIGSLQPDAASSVTYQIEVPHTAPVYMRLKGSAAGDMRINGTALWEFQYYDDWNVIPFYDQKQGDQLHITIENVSGGMELLEPEFYILDYDLLEQSLKEIASQHVEVQQMSSSKLSGTLQVDQDGQAILFTIPYDKGWNLYIDGKNVEIEKAFQDFICADIARGRHDFVLTYSPNGFTAGLYISLISIGLLTVFFLYERKQKKKIS